MPSHRFSRDVSFGTVFHAATGKLYLFRPDKHIQVIKAWPRPQGWILTPKSSWKGHHPFIHIPSGLSIDEELERIAHDLGNTQPSREPHKNLPSLLFERANLELLGTIPMGTRCAISRLPREHWHLLRLAAACHDPALDLMQSTPALAVALACSRWFRYVTRPLRSARSLMAKGRTQADIAEWLGFPGTPAAIRMLRKVDRESLRAIPLRYVRTILKDARLHRRAAHLPVLTRSCIRILSDPRLEPAVDQTFLHALADDSSLDEVWLLKDILEMHTMLEPVGTPFPSIRRLTDLDALHEALTNRLHDQDLGDAPLPPPPAPGTETIHPIETTADLQKEGRSMRHCVASLLARIIHGHAAVYRVEAPERCTMSLRRVSSHGGEWIIDQVKLARNREPSKETLWTLENWLANTPFFPGSQSSSHQSGEGSAMEEEIPF